MLPESQLELLTAAVDGELNPRQARKLGQLLATSAEARESYARLQADSARLRGLPKAMPPAGLHDRILATVAAATPAPVAQPVPAPVVTPAPVPVPFRRTRRPAWVPLAVAACLLIGVSATSFWFFSRANPNQPAAYAGKNRPDRNGPKWTDILPPEQGPLPSTPAPILPNNARVADGRRPTPPESPQSPDVIPPPRAIERSVYGYPTVQPLPPLDFIQVRFPFLVPTADLEREDVRQQFADELGRDGAVRIDLFVKDTARGVELFQNAAKASGLIVYADAAGMDRVKKKQAASVVAYTESLTPAEVRDLFARATADDAKVSPRTLDMLHATPLPSPDHRDHPKDFGKDLRDLFGGDPGLWRKPAAGPTEPKPISAGTGDMVVKTLTKGGEKSAVVLAYGPPQSRTPPAMSAELKQYLARRGERKPSTVPVVIVIRSN